MIYGLLFLPVMIAGCFIWVIVSDNLEKNKKAVEDSIWQYNGMILPKTGEHIYTFVYYHAQGSKGSVNKFVFRKQLDTIVSTNIEKDNPLYAIMKQAQLNLLKDNSYDNFEYEWNRVSSIREWC